MNKTDDQAYKFSFTEAEDYEKGFEKIFQSKLIPVLQRMKVKRDWDRIISSISIGLAISLLIILGATSQILGPTNIDEELFMLGVLTVVILFLQSRIGFNVTPRKKPSILDRLLFTLSFGVTAAFAVFHINDDIYILFWVIAFFTFLMRAPKQDYVNKIPPIIGQFLGYTLPERDEVDIEQAADLGLFHCDSILALNNTMTGTHNGLHFEMTEAQLGTTQFVSGGDTMQTKNIFKGLVMQITTEVDAPRIHFVPRSRLKFVLKHFITSEVNMKKIEFEESEFNDLYEVYTDQPEATHAFIDEHLIEGLIWLSQDSVRQSRVIGCAMKGNQLFLSIQRNNDFLSFGAPLKPMRNIERDLHLSFGDLTLPCRVIDSFFCD